MFWKFMNVDFVFMTFHMQVQYIHMHLGLRQWTQKARDGQMQ